MEARQLRYRRYLSVLFFVLVCLVTGTPGFSQQNPHKNLDMNCETCHVEQSWSIIRFDHSTTRFELLDRHREVACRSCHNIENFSEASSNCFSCHEDIHEAKMGGDCEKCHTFKGWEIFDAVEIHQNTQFPLVGKHALVDCQSCHRNQLQGDFSMLTTDCIACHQQDYLSTENPNHVSSSFSTNCQECHEMNGWRPAFLTNHDAFFPVFSGQHDGTWNDCSDCHVNGNTFTAFSCLNCHEHNQQKMDDKHRGMSGYRYASNSCLNCHPTGSGGEFRDHDNQFFPIFSGKHAGTWEDCVACHKNPGNRKEFTCLDCHEHRQSEMDVKHAGITGYAYESTECLSCHPTGDKGEFAEHDNLFFPIFSGKHAGKWDDCLICHQNPSDRKQFTCLECHEHRQSEMDAKHQGIAGYAYQSDQCLFCHPTGDKAEFKDHDNMFFPIFSGKHAGTWDDCVICHNDPANRKVFTCLQCHEHRQSEMDAKHQGITGYAYQSDQCFLCHPTGEKAEFTDHDNLYFPIFAGKHAGTWDDCTICHDNPSNRKDFNCLQCHEHRQTEMDAKHAGIQGYAYQSSQCYSCHPTGEKGNFTDHDNLYFPIFSGKHAGTWDDCVICHKTPTDRKQFTCLDCHEHRQSEMDAKHQGIAGYAYQSSECYFCHPDGQKGKFLDHDALYFPIFSGKHRNKWAECATCHIDPNNRQVFTCFNCHEHNQQKMDDKHRGIRGYVYASTACYDCHPNGKE
ncbi:MAG: hypothetical protein D6743_04160 [Calditrichaeota bacterium]|nr:MAG: hypothetical protein D6743_04160 [Calditrichota bacterium]